MDKLDLKKIRELLLFDEAICGQLLAHIEPGLDSVMFCLYHKNDKLVRLTSYESLTPIRTGDYLIVYASDGISVEKEFFVDFDYKSKGSEFVTSQEFYSWFIEGHERKAKIIRRRY